MGSLSLGDLQSGEFRFLTDREANTLRQLVDERVALVRNRWRLLLHGRQGARDGHERKRTRASVDEGVGR